MTIEDIEASKAPLMDHLIELRSRLIKALLAFGIAFIFCFFFAKQIYNVLVWPFVWVAGAASLQGKLNIINSGFAAVATVPPRFSVFGSRAVVEAVSDTHVVVRGADGAVATIDVPGETGGDRHLAPMRRFAEVVRDAVTTGEIPAHAPTFGDGRACDEVLDQLRTAPFAHALEPS
jgi:hypothetical protein